MILGFSYILCPGGLSKVKLYKIRSRIQFTINSEITSHFKWILSVPVLLMGFSLLYDPQLNRMKLLILFKGAECDWINPNKN